MFSKMKEIKTKTSLNTQSENINISPNNEDKLKFQMFEDLNFNALNNLYSKDDSSFKKTIDKLNVKFYSETNKYLGIKTELEKSQDNLFIILFKQISSYIEEIEKLNVKLKEKDEKEKAFKNKIEEFSKKEILKDDVNFFKNKIKHLEKHLVDKNSFEEKLKKEIESYKRQVNFYKDKMKIDISNTTRKLENLTHLSSNLEHYRANALSPKKSKKIYRVNNTSNLKKKIPDEASKQVNFEEINVNEFKEKFDNNNNNSQINLNAKDESQSNNLANDNFVISNNNNNNIQNKSLNLLNSKVNYDKEIHNSLNYESIRELNNSSFKEKNKEPRFNNAQLIKRPNDVVKPREANLKRKLDENMVFKKSENEKIIQNNCQNIYNVNINPIDEKTSHSINAEEVKDIFTSINLNLDEELDLLRKEEKFLNILKKELHINSNMTSSINNQAHGLFNTSQNQDSDNNNMNLFDLNYKNEITELNESLEDLNFSDLDQKLNKIELNANDSINFENQINNNANADNKIKSFKLLNLIEETMTKVSNNMENVNSNNQINNKILISKKKSKLQYNEPMPTSRHGISIQTPQKSQVVNSNALNSNLGSVANKKNSAIVEERKLNMTASKKSNNNLHSVNTKNNQITKPTKK